MMIDLLDPSALLSVLPTLLPASSSEPQLRNPSDALAALIHTILTRLDFRLVGLSEDDRLPTSSDVPTSLPNEANKLPSQWNHKGPDHYAFRYKQNQSSLDYLVKLVKLGSRSIVHGIALQGSKTSTMEVQLGDFFSTSYWPFPNKDAEPLVNGYIGSSRVKDLVIAFKVQVLQQLVPGLRKDGYTEEESAASNTGSGSGSSTQSIRNSQSNPPPLPPFAGDEDDPSLPTAQAPYRNPLIIGDRDLDPLGGSPLRLPPRFGGGSGGTSAPPPLFPGAGGDTGGGMFVGPNHPIFRDRFPQQGGQGLPQGAVPPGARFDPIYPAGAAPGQGPGGGVGRFDPFNPDPDVGGARPQNIGGEPDWDELAPPRGENSFANRGGRGGGGGFGGFGGARGRGSGGPDTGGWYS
ncbi:uncharacterized protein MEPE_03568 [Melanopsichium pennsylvanicum]|uniref:Proteasome inhibitor PI31 subunit n=2 Tax=Melanopsichium pennsylvanicum TaxID=63383 RepID=A0AAJ4XM26_9BASI|nr:conserved hypothetical protein [Melanopsichium pennsylvanicum 4]SNX84859.1 uncharacterized protein MEPE_03568 [Melanopsichium pennsylvanicum]